MPTRSHGHFATSKGKTRPVSLWQAAEKSRVCPGLR